MITNPVSRKFEVVKRVLMKDKNKKVIGTLEVGTILLVVDLTRAVKKSVKTAEMCRAEVIQANEKKVHGFCFTHDFRGNVLIQEVVESKESILDAKEEILPSTVLGRVQVLAENISQPQMDVLVDGLEKRYFKQGEVIMKEGAEGNELFIFIRGRAQISEKDTMLGVLIPGDYFGEQALNNLEKSCEWVRTVTALTEVVCLVASQKIVKIALHKEEGEQLVIQEERVAFSTKRSRRPTANKGPAVNPSGRQIEFIKDAVKDTTLFSRLNDKECLAVIKKMRLEMVPAFHDVITQGDCDGVKFYVIKKGAFEIIIDGKQIETYERGRSFGERALIQDAPRAATVQSGQPSEVWVLDRDDYRFTVLEESEKNSARLLKFLGTLKTFQGFSKKDLSILADSFEEVKYEDKQRIITQGDKGDRFYVIMHGVARYTKKDKKGNITAHGPLTEGNYFGELALTTGEARAASVTAHSGLTCLELSKEEFDNLLKPLENVFEVRRKAYMEITRSTYRRVSAMQVGLEENKEEDDILLKIDTPLKGLRYIGLLGKGAFGLVTLVQDPATESNYALKAIRKHDIVEHGQVEHVVNEKNIQNSLKTPFCVKLYRTYKDEFRIYFLLEACTGGDIFTILRKRRNFNEKATRFYAACIIAAFDHMHGRKIIYRDLKPENLVMDHTGYCKLTDFGFAKIVEGKTSTVCGTPDYLAPEVIIGRGHDKGVDFWTLGIFIYECLNGVAPFYSRKDMDTYRKILRSQVLFTKRMSSASKDLVQRLLRKKAAKRLGVRKGEDIHTQPFFAKGSKWSWEKFLRLEVKAPYPPRKLALKDPNIKRYRLFDKDIKCPLHDFEKEF